MYLNRHDADVDRYGNDLVSTEAKVRPILHMLLAVGLKAEILGG